MPTFRVKADGYFMGKYYKTDTELVLHEREAKYALLSEQLERVATFSQPSQRTTPIEPQQRVSANDGERFGRRSIGASFGGLLNTKR